MRARLLAALAFSFVFGLWGEVCQAQAPSGTKAFDLKTTNTDAAIKAATDAARAAAALKDWGPPRTAWGDPDLQGFYLNLSYTQVGTWLGDSRGHWEGNTLVIDTSNFNPDRNWRGSTGGMHLVERLTRVDPKTLKYEFTVTDPTTWTRPWSVEYPWPQIEPGLYEFACHEQNYGLINVVMGAQIRAREAAARGGFPCARHRTRNDEDACP